MEGLRAWGGRQARYRVSLTWSTSPIESVCVCVQGACGEQRVRVASAYGDDGGVRGGVEGGDDGGGADGGVFGLGGGVDGGALGGGLGGTDGGSAGGGGEGGGFALWQAKVLT